jgi:spore germination cell wall hydrolase CwlJ-like protein
MNVIIAALLVVGTMGINNHSHSNEDMLWLALTVYHEARGESRSGKLAVASVVINRVDSSKWGGTIENVVRQPAQFEGVPNGNVYLLAFRASRGDQAAWKASSEAAEESVKYRWIYRTIYRWDHYYAPLVRLQRGFPAAPGWAAGMVKKCIGEHIFCMEKTK